MRGFTAVEVASSASNNVDMVDFETSAMRVLVLVLVRVLGCSLSNVLAPPCRY